MVQCLYSPDPIKRGIETLRLDCREITLYSNMRCFSVLSAASAQL